jgi:hypothetical protein
MRSNQTAKQAITLASIRYRFLAPAALLNPEEARERHYDPKRKAHKEYIVTLEQFPAFCESFGLDQGEMQRLWDGDMQTYKGWRAKNDRWASRQHDRELDELNRANRERVSRYVPGGIFEAGRTAESRKPLALPPEKWTA